MTASSRSIFPRAKLTLGVAGLLVGSHVCLWSARAELISPTALVLCLVALGGAALLWVVRWPKRFLGCGALVLGIAWGFVRPLPEPWPTEKVSVIGTVWSVEPEQGLRLQEASLEASGRPFPRELFIEAAPFELPPVGTRVRVELELRQSRLPLNPRLTPPREPSLYGYALHTPEVLGEASWVSQLALTVRERLSFQSETTTTLQRALLLGDRSALTLEERLAYQDTGTAHLLAISGMNLALLGLGLFVCLKGLLVWLPGLERLRQGRGILGIAASASLLLVALYGKLIAPSDATDRAILAFGFMMVGVLCMRRIAGPWALGWGILTLCTFDPGVWLRAGFQLSVAATSSLLLLVAPFQQLSHLLERWEWPTWLRTICLWWLGLLATNLVTFAATASLGLAWFGQLPWHGLWVNLVAVPWMSLGTFPVGLLWVLLALISPTLAEPFKPWVEWLSEGFHDFILASAQMTSAATASAWPLALGMLGTLAVLAAMTRRYWRWGVLGLLGCALVAQERDPLPEGLSLVTLDVGHGDALLLRLPSRKFLLIDTGGTWETEANAQLALRTLLPALQALGVRRLEALVLTHADADHVGAALALAQRLPIAALWLPPCATQKPLVQKVVQDFKARKRPIFELSKTAAQSWEGLTLEILWPPADVTLEEGCLLDANNASLVMRLSYQNRSILLTGDIEHEVEAQLIAQAPESLRAEVLKSPHHGSKSSSTTPFLEMVRPHTVLVSGLLGKAPMPPHESILERYAKSAMRVWITSEHGALLTQISPEGDLYVGPLMEFRPP